MNKTKGGALALLSALVMLCSGSAAQAQGLLDTIKNIAANQVANGYLGPNTGAYDPYYGAYGTPGYYPASGSGGILNGVANAVKNKYLNGYAQNYIDPNLYNTAYNGINPLTGQYDPYFGYNNAAALNGAALNGGACQNGAAWNNAAWNNAGWNNANLSNVNWSNANGIAAGGCNRGHRKHRHNRYTGPSNGFYSFDQGVPLGGVGYNPLLVGR